MVQKVQMRFILIASIAVIFVMCSFGFIINAVVYGLFRMQAMRAMDALLEWRREEDVGNPFSSDRIDGTLLNNHFFCVVLNPDGQIVDLDLTYDTFLDKEQAVSLSNMAMSQGSSFGFINTWKINYIYKTLPSDKSGNTGVAFLNCAPIQNTLFTLRKASALTGVFFGIGFIAFFSLFSRRAVALLIRNMENQKRFITNASHELKTPLAIVSANAELLEAISGKNEWTENIRCQTKRMTDLINELIALNKINESTIISSHKVDLSAIINFVVSDMIFLFHEQKIILTHNIEPNLQIIGDEKLLTMLVNILMENAAKYCDTGGVTDVVLRREKNKGGILLSVSNHYKAGEHMDYSRFFERFYRINPSHNNSKSGFGIGLSAVQEIVAIMKGRIWVEYWENRIFFYVRFAL